MVGSPAVPCCSVSTLVEGAAHSTRQCYFSECFSHSRLLASFLSSQCMTILFQAYRQCAFILVVLLRLSQSVLRVLGIDIYSLQYSGSVFMLEVVRSVVWQICTMWYTLDARLGITCRGVYAGEAQQCPACSKKSCKCSSQHSHHELYRCSVLCVSVSLQE